MSPCKRARTPFASLRVQERSGWGSITMVGLPSHATHSEINSSMEPRGRVLGPSVSQRGLEAMKHVDELVPLLLGEARHPPLLMPMHNQPKLVGDPAADIGELDE